MKRLENVAIKNLRGVGLRVPLRDDAGEVLMETDSKPRTRDATVSLLLQEFLNLPASLLTRQDTIHGHRLYNQLWESTEKGTDRILQIEDAEWDWVMKKLEDDKIGPKLLGMSLDPVIHQLTELETAGRTPKKGVEVANG